MRSPIGALVGLALTLALSPAAAQEKLTNYQLVVVKPDQHKQGKLVFAGPFVDGGTHRGLVVYRVTSMEEARTRAEGDPMIKVGRLAVDLHRWQVPKGALPNSER